MSLIKKNISRRSFFVTMILFSFLFHKIFKTNPRKNKIFWITSHNDH